MMRAAACALLASLLLAACQGPPGGSGLASRPVAAPAAEDAVVIYGGLGFLNGEAQPVLADLVRQREPGEAPPAYDASRIAFPIVQGLVLDGIATAPVVTTSAELKAVLARKHGTEAAEIGGREIRDEIMGSDILVLTVLGGLEADAVMGVSPPLEGWRAASLATVTAMLSRPQSGEILLAVDATALVQDRPPGGPEDARARLQRVVRAYEAAARAALTALKTQTKGYAQGRGLRTMVTDVRIDPGAASGFSFPIAGGTGMCADLREADPCPPGGAGLACRKLRAAAAAVATEALADQGAAMLPPWAWAQFFPLVKAQTRTLTASVPTTGGVTQLNNRLNIVLEPDKAERKVVLGVGRLATTLVDGSNGLKERGLRAAARLDAFGGSCAAPTPAGMLGQPRSSERGFPEHPAMWRASGGVPPADLELIWAVGALREALGQGGTS